MSIHPFKLLLCLTALVYQHASATTILVSKTPIEIDAPLGYVYAGPELATLHSQLETFVISTNLHLAEFITKSDYQLAVKGDNPLLVRRYSVQTFKKSIHATIRLQEFVHSKQELKTYSEQTRADVDRVIADGMDKIAGRQKVELAMTGKKMYAPHYETERVIASSAHMMYKINDGNGEPTSFTAAITYTIALVKGKLMFIYAYGGEDDLEWSRASSKDWVQQIMQRNPSDVTTLIMEKSPRPGIWDGAIAKGIGGGLTGGLAVMIILIIGWLRRRMR
jgi:hypothetical protein